MKEFYFSKICSISASYDTKVPGRVVWVVRGVVLCRVVLLRSGYYFAVGVHLEWVELCGWLVLCSRQGAALQFW